MLSPLQCGSWETFQSPEWLRLTPWACMERAAKRVAFPEHCPESYLQPLQSELDRAVCRSLAGGTLCMGFSP